LAITISVLALLATFYQLYLQRVHNEKSLRPLGQIDLIDINNEVSVRVVNNGMGPMIIDRLTFFREGNSYTNIDDCLTLDSRSYQRIPVNETLQKIILPNASLDVFSTEFEAREEKTNIENALKQLATIAVRVYFRDIYDNRFTMERNLDWFSRYMTDQNSGSHSTSKLCNHAFPPH
jgi:hypothetical protein